MAALDEVNTRLQDYKTSGLVADYEVIVVDDSVRLRVVAPHGADPAKIKTFIAESLAGLISESQIGVEPAGE